MINKLTKSILYAFLALLPVFLSCKKNNKPKEKQLPAATQIGANTFGCYVNGKLYTNSGYDSPFPNFRLVIDPGLDYNLDVQTYNYRAANSRLGFSGFGIRGVGIYQINSNSTIYPHYAQDANSNNCLFISDPSNYKIGFLKITKYDLSAGIISGEFEFTLFDSTIYCDTIKITQGRFDKKL